MQPDDFARQAGLVFSDPGLLRRALTHRSYINEHPDVPEDNERLEFLGDAALDLLSAAWLYRRFPEMDEGELTRLRSVLVRTEQLAEFAGHLQLGEAILLGRGEDAMGGRQRLALLCDAFEAIVGALYLDGGLEAVMRFMEPRFEQAVQTALEDETFLDPRSRLQMWAQSERGETPRYETIGSSGPDHAREFLVEVVVGSQTAGQGKGRSKQEAAQAAAADALMRLEPLRPVRERRGEA
ncbi:MAG TPA: ribonuclease III [Anaerolineales bacterium]|nr:ribonuclease III [Anaerolineales bacterium]